MIQAISQACVSLVQSVPIGFSLRLREMSHFAEAKGPASNGHATLRLLRPLPNHPKGSRTGDRRSRGWLTSVGPREREQTFLIGSIPVRERTSLNVHADHTVRLTDRVRTEIRVAPLHGRFVFFRGPAMPSLDANLGSPARMTTIEKRPLLSNIREPIGFGPNDSIFFLPCSRVAETSVQDPTSSLAVWPAASPEGRATARSSSDIVGQCERAK